GLADRHRHRLVIPADERSAVQHRVAQFVGPGPAHSTRLIGWCVMIGVTRDEAVTTIELQRPERRNALISQLVTELREAIVAAATHDVRAIVLTGQGTVFCAGADLSGDAFAADYPDKLIALHTAIGDVPVP